MKLSFAFLKHALPFYFAIVLLSLTFDLSCPSNALSILAFFSTYSSPFLPSVDRKRLLKASSSLASP